ncbi:hypothetical protein [Prosthecobacter sp.]|uniref:hypothetical protein n=1 Tax=Prosthecobacter sp. TaxID=1965333 RepID=UPI002ABB95EF|nr:hypothetical protein [Prosthecobacter sp.]MDZ4401116.1 hypothetical protein [Prosthecobacter sp.]
MSDSSDFLSQPAARQFLQKCAHMRGVLQRGRGLIPAHAEFKPNFDLHEQRLDEIERLFREAKPENAARIQALNEEFLLDMNADIATVVGETQERMVRFTDNLAKKFEEKKFELPAEVRDGLEDILQPYHDGLRDKMLGELPIETRRELEEAKRRLDEDE